MLLKCRTTAVLVGLLLALCSNIWPVWADTVFGESERQVQLSWPPDGTSTRGDTIDVVGALVNVRYDEVWVRGLWAPTAEAADRVQLLEQRARLEDGRFVSQVSLPRVGSMLIQISAVSVDDEAKEIHVVHECRLVAREEPAPRASDEAHVEHRPVIKWLGLPGHLIEGPQIVGIEGVLGSGWDGSDVWVNDVRAKVTAGRVSVDILARPGQNTLRVETVKDGTQRAVWEENYWCGASVEVEGHTELDSERIVPTVVVDGTPTFYCLLDVVYENSDRAVTRCNQECPPSWHSLPWGNWGVDTSLSRRVDGNQFPGWHVQYAGQVVACRPEVAQQRHWNSCTQDHLPGDSTYYNWPQGSYEYQYSGDAAQYASGRVYLNTNETAGCARFAGYTVVIDKNYMDLYELDCPDADDFIGRLNFHPLYIPLSACGYSACGVGAKSDWSRVDRQKVNFDGVTAKIRAKVTGSFLLETR